MMKNDSRFTSSNLFDGGFNKSNGLYLSNEKKILDFNANVGLLIIFSIFALFFMFSIIVMMSFGVMINPLPLVVAIILSVIVGLALILLSHAIDMVDVLINKYFYSENK